MVRLIKYKKRRGFKYILYSQTSYPTGIIPDVASPKADWAELDKNGLLTIKAKYTWDGPSGPAFDTPNFMRGSLIHDALYQLMREEVLPQSVRKRADEILREICIEDGMSKARAWWVYTGVRVGAAKSAKPNLITAPRK